MSLAFQNIDGVIYTTSEMYIQIVKCSEIYLNENEKCASEELVEQFFSQPVNTIILQLHYKQLNSRDGTEQTSYQEFYIQIERQNCYTLNTFLQSNFYEVQDSFLFGFSRYIEYINGAIIQLFIIYNLLYNLKQIHQNFVNKVMEMMLQVQFSQQ